MVRLASFAALFCAATSAFASPVASVQEDVESSVLVARQSAASVVSAIYVLGNDTVKLNRTLNTFKANDVLGFVKALQIQQQTTQIETDLQNAISAANNSPAFTDDQSNAVALAVINYEPLVKSLLNNIVVHKPAFATAVFLVGDLSKTVLADLQQQSSLASQFSTAVTNKLTPNYAQFAPLIAAQIQSYFTTAINAYQSCTGVVCLPPITS